MVTPAREAATKASGEIKAQADLVEDTLEEHIGRGAIRVSLSAYQGQGFVGKDTLGHGFLPHGTTYPALIEVKRRYELAGWRVNLNNSQRDGMYINIEAVA